MTPSASPANNQVILERIDAMRADVAELKGLFQQHTATQIAFERESAVVRADHESKLIAAHRRLDDLEKRDKERSDQIDALRAAVQPLIYTNKILTWLAVLLGGSIVTLIISIVTHQVTIVVP